MISRPIFHLFLTLSVVIILLGILLVIFTQFDREYVVIDSENRVNAKQNSLIKQISQTTAKISLDETGSKNEDQNDTGVLNLIDQVKQDDSKVNIMSDGQSQTATDQEIARINHLNQQNYMTYSTPGPTPYSSNGYDDYQRHWLSNNPWSADYTPNRRY